MFLQSLKCKYVKFVKGFESAFVVVNNGTLECDAKIRDYAMLWYNNRDNQMMMSLIVDDVPTLDLKTPMPRDITTTNENKVKMTLAFSIAVQAYVRYCEMLGRDPKRLKMKDEDTVPSSTSKAELRAAKTEAEQAYEAAMNALETARSRTEAAEHAVKEAAGNSSGRVLAALCQAFVKATEDKVSAKSAKVEAEGMAQAAGAALNLYVSEKRKERQAKQLLEAIAAEEETAAAAATEEEMPSPDRRVKNKKRARRHHETEEE